jgi:hypothetical protein
MATMGFGATCIGRDIEGRELRVISRPAKQFQPLRGLMRKSHALSVTGI